VFECLSVWKVEGEGRLSIKCWVRLPGYTGGQKYMIQLHLAIMNAKNQYFGLRSQ